VNSNVPILEGMNKMVESLKEMFSRAWSLMLEQSARVIPKFLLGMLILLVGIVIARVIRGLAARFFLAIRLDRLSTRLGIASFLARGDVRHTVAEILATALYWLVLIFSLEIMGLALGLDGMARFFGQIIAYIPHVLIAVAIVLAGIVIGSVIGGTVRVAGANAGLRAADLVGSIMKYLIGFFALVMALEQLHIATPLLVSTLQIITAAVGLAFALAFGLGCRDLAAEAVRDWLGRKASLGEQKGPDRVNL
jgi:Mechanosensitive ion channel, conserved TM helix